MIIIFNKLNFIFFRYQNNYLIVNKLELNEIIKEALDCCCSSRLLSSRFSGPLMRDDVQFPWWSTSTIILNFDFHESFSMKLLFFLSFFAGFPKIFETFHVKELIEIRDKFFKNQDLTIEFNLIFLYHDYRVSIMMLIES